MTPDDFTEAASAAAEEQWTRDHTPGHPLSGPERMNRRIGFTMGAAWARDRLTTQEPTDAEVEAAARAMRIETLGDTVRPGAAARWWDNGDVSPDEADKLRRLTRAALSAARAARRDEEKR